MHYSVVDRIRGWTSLQVRLKRLKNDKIFVSVMMSDFALKLEPDDKIVYSGKKLGEEPVLATLKITNPTKVNNFILLKLIG